MCQVLGAFCFLLNYFYFCSTGCHTWVLAIRFCGAIILRLLVWHQQRAGWMMWVGARWATTICNWATIGSPHLLFHPLKSPAAARNAFITTFLNSVECSCCLQVFTTVLDTSHLKAEFSYFSRSDQLINFSGGWCISFFLTHSSYANITIYISFLLELFILFSLPSFCVLESMTVIYRLICKFFETV